MIQTCSNCGKGVAEKQANRTKEAWGFFLCSKCQALVEQIGSIGVDGKIHDAPEEPEQADEQIEGVVNMNYSDTTEEPVRSDYAGFQIVDEEACTVTHYLPKPITKYTDAQIETIKNTVAKGISNHELSMFMHLCKVYGLDPFLKEIFYSSQMKTIMTSRDGYLKVAQRDPTYEGMQSMAVCENDEFEIDAVTPTVKHVFGKGDRGSVIGAWAMVHKVGRRPVISYADIREYRKESSTWRTYPSAMICKVAEVFALKRQFGISGLVTQEELE
jgi:phage recombination protein Bet